MGFSDIPVRTNGQDVEASWFNTIRTQLVSWFGTGVIAESQDTIDNAGSAESVVGLLFSGAAVRSAKIQYQIYRKTDSYEYSEAGQFFVTYKTVDTSWEIGGESSTGDADTTFAITDAGQVTYTSSNMSGASYTGKMRFKAETLSVES